MPVPDYTHGLLQNPQNQPKHGALAAADLAEDHQPVTAKNLENDPIQDSFLPESQHNIFQMNQGRVAHPVILVTITLNSVSNPMTVVIEITTLSVVAFPTPSAPPLTVSPW